MCKDHNTPLLTEEEYRNYLIVLEDESQEDVQSFLKLSTVELLRKLIKYENEMTKNIFDALKERMKEITYTLNNDDSDALYSLIDNTDSPRDLLDIYQSSRYAYLVQQVEQELEEVNQYLKDELRDDMTEAYSRTYLGAGHILSQILPSDVINSNSVPIEQVDAMIESPNHGKTLYERIDDLTKHMNTIIIGLMMQGMISGKSMPDIIGEIQKRLMGDVRRAEVITRTEIMRASNGGIIQLYKDNSDIVKGVEYVATLDLRTCSECGSHDGDRFLWDEPRPSLPLHPRCRCTYSPIVISVQELNDRFGLNLNNIPIPENERPTWEDWMRYQIQRGNLEDAELIRRIFGSRAGYESFVNQFN
ncbi:MAG: minor capsid protein [archaeon]